MLSKYMLLYGWRCKNKQNLSMETKPLLWQYDVFTAVIREVLKMHTAIREYRVLKNSKCNKTYIEL